MVKVGWTLQAVDDIENIANFISKDSYRYAQIQVQRFFEVTLILETNAEFGRVVPELNNPTIREIILGTYRIIYRIVSNDRIDVLTVHHSKRLLGNNPLFKNKE
jgi:toxin ParE1/3/4